MSEASSNLSEGGRAGVGEAWARGRAEQAVSLAGSAIYCRVYITWSLNLAELQCPGLIMPIESS